MELEVVSGSWDTQSLMSVITERCQSAVWHPACEEQIVDLTLMTCVSQYSNGCARQNTGNHVHTSATGAHIS